MIDLPKYFDLSVEMKKLYISKDYYAPIKRNNNFSKDDYWLESVDPDISQMWSGDINSDGAFDVLDVVLLVNLVLAR